MVIADQPGGPHIVSHHAAEIHEDEGDSRGCEVEVEPDVGEKKADALEGAFEDVAGIRFSEGRIAIGVVEGMIGPERGGVKKAM